MNKERTMELMGGIDPALVAEADLPMPAKRRIPKITRAVLVAACLCLALIGTAAAVHYSGVRIADGDDGVTYLQGGIAYYPYDSLSDEIKALEVVRTTQNSNLIRAVSSWQEAEDFIGINLMDNPVLDAAPATHYGHIFDGVNSPFMVLTDDALSSVRVYGCYEMGEVNILVDAVLFTDRKAGLAEDWDEWFLGYKFTEGTQVNRDTYTAPSGLTAQILEITYPDGLQATYKAAVSLNGIPAVITAEDSPDARAALLQILDGFIL